VETCADRHDQSPLTFQVWEEKGVVRYSATDFVEVLIRVVLEDDANKVWGRLVLWDGARLSVRPAEMLAAPVVEVLDTHYGAATVEGVEVWQCRTLERHTVTATRARAMRNTVAAHIARM
jgi:hypothetical protein